MEVGSGAGDAEELRWRITLSKCLHEWRPLEAVRNVEIDDVDWLMAVDCFQDGLVGGEMSESEERGELVE